MSIKRQQTVAWKPNFVAVVTQMTSRRQVFSILLPGLTAKLNNKVLKSIHTKSDILKEARPNGLEIIPFQVSETITGVIPVSKRR